MMAHHNAKTIIMMIMMMALVFPVWGWSTSTTPDINNKSPSWSSSSEYNNDVHRCHLPLASSRRHWIQSSAFGILLPSLALSPAPAASSDVLVNNINNNSQPSTPEEPARVPVYQTSSGLKYLDLKVGTGPSPDYGQLVSIRYAGYMQLPATTQNPDPPRQPFDQAAEFLLKHGSGRLIPGLDEGLHTMKVGGIRRLLIPPKLGYIESGLGPIPELPWNRWRLNQLLTDMVEQVGGTLIFDVKLLGVMDDEADQGYYQDTSFTPQQLEQLRNNLQRRAAEAAAARGETPSADKISLSS